MNAPCTSSCGCTTTSATETQDDPAAETAGLSVSTYHIPQMDCPSEERLIRLALQQDSVKGMRFDLPGRRLDVFHEGPVQAVTERLQPLGLGAVLKDSRSAAQEPVEALPPLAHTAPAGESRVLYLLLAINAVMFVVELVAGLIAQSTGLMADSLDMLADAAVYGLALYAVGRGVQMQVRAAHVAGYLQLILAIGVLLEVARRFVWGSEPESMLMMSIAFVALLANVTCLLLIARHRHGGAHMKASWIFSANDVLINAGVIAAGALVAWTGSRYPDLLIGSVIGVIVLIGARRILALKG